MCKYCDPENGYKGSPPEAHLCDEQVPILNGKGSIGLDVWFFENGVLSCSVNVMGEDIIYKNTEFKFCPMCGRKL